MISEILQAKLTDYCFIRISSRLNDRIGSLHLALDPKIVHRGEMPVGEEGTKPFNEEKHVRTSGQVIAAPTNLTRKPLREKYEGTPKYSHHMTHEDIKSTMERMPPSILKNYGRNMYNPGNPPESLEYQPNNPEIKAGDKIYFEYTVLLNESYFVDSDSEGEVWMVPYQSIYCYVRDGKINMVNGWVFVESVAKEQVSKYIIFVNNKPQHYVGSVAHAGKWLETFVPNTGDTCLFIRTLFTVKNWDSLTDEHEVSGYEVEGKLFYPLRNWEIVATQVDGQWQCVNDYVKVIPETIDVINKVKVKEYDPNESLKYEPGVIYIPKGSNVQDKKKKILNYGIGECEGERILYCKSNYYLYLDDTKVLFIHKKDILGTLTTD